MNRIGWRVPVFIMLGLLAFALSASAQPTWDKPGSVLVFPYFNEEGGTLSFFTITNSNGDVRNLPLTPYQYGTVKLKFKFINLITEGNPNEPDDDTCQSTNKTRILTPNEAFSGVMRDFNDQHKKGWFYVAALDPLTGQRIDFDFLMGSMFVIDPNRNHTWAYTAYSFEALSGPVGPKPPPSESLAGYRFTDKLSNGGNNDGKITFTGFVDMDTHEYEAWPRNMFIPNFLDQTNVFKSYLVLLTPLDRDWVLNLDFTYYNDTEREMGSEAVMGCWVMKPLLYFMEGADTLSDGHGIEGLPDIYTGWAIIESVDAYDRTGASQPSTIDNPPFMGMILHTIGGKPGPMHGAHLLHHEGDLNEGNTDWSLDMEAGD